MNCPPERLDTFSAMIGKSPNPGGVEKPVPALLALSSLIDGALAATGEID